MRMVSIDHLNPISFLFCTDFSGLLFQNHFMVVYELLFVVLQHAEKINISFVDRRHPSRRVATKYVNPMVYA